MDLNGFFSGKADFTKGCFVASSWQTPILLTKVDMSKNMARRSELRPFRKLASDERCESVGLIYWIGLRMFEMLENLFFTLW